MIGRLIIMLILIVPMAIGVGKFLKELKEPFVTLFFVVFIGLPLLGALASVIGEIVHALFMTCE